MNATIEAAKIAAITAGAVGGLGLANAVAIAYLGFRNTRNTTEKIVSAGAANIRATLAAAREERLWERQCSAYEETLAEIRHRMLKRRHDLRGFRLDEDSEQQRNDFFDSYQPPNWFQAQARLTAYASDPVLEAFEAAERAHLEVRARYQRYRAMADDNREAAASGNHALAHDGKETVEARHAVDPAVEEAEAVDGALIKLIRDELRSKPEAAIDPGIWSSINQY